MCKVLTRKYEECKHEFHQNDAPCRKFIVELQEKAKKNPPETESLSCSRHASCSDGKLKPVNQATIGTQTKPRLVPITRVGNPSDLDGVGWWGWTSAKPCDHPRVVEGHCATKELNFIRERRPIPGVCGDCQSKRGSGWWARWVGR